MQNVCSFYDNKLLDKFLAKFNSLNSDHIPERSSLSDISIVVMIVLSGNILGIILRNQVGLGSINDILNHCDALFLTSEMILFETCCSGILEAAQSMESAAVIVCDSIWGVTCV